MNLNSTSSFVRALFLILFVIPLLLFSSCNKEADASLIKVSSTPLTGAVPGTIPGSGAGAGSIIKFTIDGQDYTIENGTSGIVSCAGSPAIGALPAGTSLQGANNAQTLTFSLYSGNYTPGTYPLDKFSIATPDGNLYTPTDKASITYDTYTTKATYIAVTKGSFTIPAKYGALPDQKTTTITGTFDVK